MEVAVPISGAKSRQLQNIAFSHRTSVGALAQLAVNQFLLDPNVEAITASDNDDSTQARLGKLVVHITDDTVTRLELVCTRSNATMAQLLQCAVERLLQRLQAGSLPLVPRAVDEPAPKYQSEEYFNRCCADMLGTAKEEIDRLMLPSQPPYGPSSNISEWTFWNTASSHEVFRYICKFYREERQRSSEFWK